MPRPSRYLSVPLLTAAVWMALPAMAQEWGEPEDGVKLERAASPVTQIVPAEVIEQQAAQEYEQIKQEAIAKRALGNDTNPQLLRLRAIGKRLLPETTRWNPRARDWNWEINLIGSKQINAFCMPGGKIAFYTGLLDQLNLTDDELAMAMGHEIAHALMEHARQRAAKSEIANLGANVVSQLFGFGNLGNMELGTDAHLLTLKFTRQDETEADLVGMDLAARAGYDPRAAVTLWQKMALATGSPSEPKTAKPAGTKASAQADGQGGSSEFLSTHPSGRMRIAVLQRHLPEVLPLYARTLHTSVAELPAYRSNVPLAMPEDSGGAGAAEPDDDAAQSTKSGLVEQKRKRSRH